ncbi:glycosyltransferase family protein [Bdellovibrio reynosensis]|uniref:Glycosyltransferase family protein n=1 Tax=Bdellovibrio reynosensis TaxID=2835041 RepID=A0ABY4CBA6_9BACT|nr:glycosyltransferase family protein [Bdellovibrio reynosensis]UOF02256.1 glycosyltransferase family protein [Bdellovibrio reynosensis]
MAVKAGIITQARMTSTRLPGKVLKEVRGVPLLKYHIDRLSWSQLPVVVATTINREDDPIVQMCQHLKVPYFRGSEQDVLGRFYGAAEQEKLDIIVRVTSDCPLIDGHLISKAVQDFKSKNSENIYLSNCLKRSFPRGMDFEVFSFADLKTAFHEADKAFQREHVTPFINQNVTGMIKQVDFTSDDDYSSWRLTVDEESDFALIKKMIEDFRCDEMTFDQLKVVLKTHPELKLINAHIEQKKL